MKRTALIVAGFIALALTAAACGGGSRRDSGAGASKGSTTTTASSSTAGPGVDPNAAEVNPAGDIPDNQVFVASTPPSGGFSIKVPEGWARTEAGGAVTFTGKLNSIRMESGPAPTAPTVQSAEQTGLPAIRAAAKNFQAGKVAPSPARPARRCCSPTWAASAPGPTVSIACARTAGRPF